jgi:hypothetical protein
VALAFRILDHAGGVLRVQGVHDVEEVFTLDLSALRLCVWHVAAELWLLHHHGHEVLDRQFIVKRDVDPLYLVHPEEVLAFFEHIFEEVLVKTGVWRKIELH